MSLEWEHAIKEQLSSLIYSSYNLRCCCLAHASRIVLSWSLYRNDVNYLAYLTFRFHKNEING